MLTKLGFTSSQLEGIFEAAKCWLKDCPDSIPPFQMAYYYKGELLIMPYPIKRLKKYSIGICINGVVYLKRFYNSVYGFKDQPQKNIEKLLDQIAKDFCDKIREFKPRLPSKDELFLLVSYTYGKHFPGIDFSLANSAISRHWITPPMEFPERTNAEVTNRRELVLSEPRPSEPAYLGLCFYVTEEQAFFGKINHSFGVIDEETQAKLNELLGEEPKTKGNSVE